MYVATSAVDDDGAVGHFPEGSAEPSPNDGPETDKDDIDDGGNMRVEPSVVMRRRGALPRSCLWGLGGRG